MSKVDRRRKAPVRAREYGGRVPKACSSGKRLWLNRQDAVQAGRWADGKYGGKHQVYRCRLCRQYHLTTGGLKR